MDLPERIGRFEIIELIAWVAVGAVYKARDPEKDSLIVLKVWEAGHATLESNRRWLSQAKHSCSLRHPNFVNGYDSGVVDHIRFLATDLPEGESLDSAIRKKAPLSLSEKISIIRQIAEALQYLHDHGLIHGNVKPSNILLLGDAKAMLMGLEPPYFDLIDVETVIPFDTPTYLSPEQLNGEEGDVRNDIFSVGRVFYELVEDTGPFQGETLTEVIVKTLRDPPAASQKACELHLPELQRIFDKTLAKPKQARYPSCVELQRDLDYLKQRLESGREAEHQNWLARLTRKFR